MVLTQVVLLDTYAKGYDSTLNGYTGMGVSLIIIGLGLYMIISIKKDNIVNLYYLKLINGSSIIWSLFIHSTISVLCSK